MGSSGTAWLTGVLAGAAAGARPANDDVLAMSSGTSDSLSEPLNELRVVDRGMLLAAAAGRPWELPPAAGRTSEVAAAASWPPSLMLWARKAVSASEAFGVSRLMVARVSVSLLNWPPSGLKAVLAAASSAVAEPGGVSMSNLAAVAVVA